MLLREGGYQLVLALEHSGPPVVPVAESVMVFVEWQLPSGPESDMQFGFCASPGKRVPGRLSWTRDHDSHLLPDAKPIWETNAQDRQADHWATLGLRCPNRV